MAKYQNHGKQKAWRTEARTINLVKGRKNCGRKAKEKHPLQVSGLSRLMTALFKKAGIKLQESLYD